MRDPELFDRADALLAECARPPDRPFYRDATFAYKLRRDRDRAFKPKEPPPDPNFAPMLRQEILTILNRSGLSARERSTLREWMEGRTFQEIGQVQGVSKQMVHKVFSNAIKKIRASYHVYPYAGLHEVFREEITRGKRATSYGTLHR